MATDSTGDLSAFIQFANAQLEAGTKLSLGEAIDQWYADHPEEMSVEENEEILAMAKVALDGIAAGDKGMSIEEFDREFRRRNKIV